jgi:hypothetical protein
MKKDYVAKTQIGFLNHEEKTRPIVYIPGQCNFRNCKTKKKQSSIFTGRRIKIRYSQAEKINKY